MALTPTYSVGTVSVSAGGSIVTGSGTLFFASGARQGDVFEHAGLTVSIESVDSNVQITLSRPWPGPTVSGAPYDIRYTPDAARVLAASRQAIAMFDEARPLLDGALPTFADAVSKAANASTLRTIPAIVEGQLQEWVADPAGTALGGGWKAADKTTVRAFGGDLAAAHATGEPVDYGSKLWAGDASSGYFNLYGASKYRTASYDRIQLGLNGSPVNDPRPVYAVHKFTSADRSADASAWDQTAYFSLVKKTGNAFGAALTGFARSDGGDGDMIGVHARAARYTANGRGYGLWAYFAGYVESTQPGHAAEVNGFTTYDPGYGSTHQLVRLVMADSSSDVNRFGTALSIGPATLGGANNGFHTGIRVEAGAIIRTTGDDGEFLRIDAPILGDGSIGGFRFAKGNAGHAGIFKYALRTDEATFAGNEAIRLANGQRVSWFNGGVRVGSLTGGATALSLTGVMLNVVNPVSNVALQAAGVSVVGTRKTGWSAPTGTTTRTTFATSTVTTAQLAERVKALIDDLTSHGLIGE